MWRKGMWLVGLAACGGESTDDVDATLQPAPLVEPSDACPDMSSTGEKSIRSNGVKRGFQLVMPKEVHAGMPLLFVWHGLGPSSPDPVQIFVDGFDLQSVARSRDAIVVVPRAEEGTLPGFPVLLWGILGHEENDLALFDDLRACASRELEVDLKRVYSWGFSGGGLWSSLLTMHRSDAHAAIAIASGGVDIDVLAEHYLDYRSPAYAELPVLMAAGGPSDKWPDPSLTILDFEVATDNLQEGLLADAHDVVRCRHTTGHNVPSAIWDQSKSWLFDHVFGEPSPYAGGGRKLSGGCEVAE